MRIGLILLLAFAVFAFVEEASAAPVYDPSGSIKTPSKAKGGPMFSRALDRFDDCTCCDEICGVYQAARSEADMNLERGGQPSCAPHRSLALDRQNKYCSSCAKLCEGSLPAP